jgi:hypothetical protein
MNKVKTILNDLKEEIKQGLESHRIEICFW